jgi:hypothetical protein
MKAVNDPRAGALQRHAVRPVLPASSPRRFRATPGVTCPGRHFFASSISTCARAKHHHQQVHRPCAGQPQLRAWPDRVGTIPADYRRAWCSGPLGCRARLWLSRAGERSSPSAGTNFRRAGLGARSRRCAGPWHAGRGLFGAVRQDGADPGRAYLCFERSAAGRVGSAADAARMMDACSLRHSQREPTALACCPITHR